jgi:hypothetical protein
VQSNVQKTLANQGFFEHKSQTETKENNPKKEQKIGSH